MKKANLITGIIFLLIGIGALVIALPMSAKLPTDPLGPSWWPKYLSIALILFSALLIGQALLTPKEKDKPAPFDFKSEGFHRMMKLCGVLILFAIITYVVGIYIGLLLMVPTVMYLLGERNKKLLVIFAIGTCIFVYVVFKRLLMVPLPTGLFFG